MAKHFTKKRNTLPNSVLPWKPHIFDLRKKNHVLHLETLFESGKILKISDDYVEQLRELYHIQRPTLKKAEVAKLFQTFLKKLMRRKPLWKEGRWVYFPWNGSLVHILVEPDFQLLRMARNKLLISEKEQDNFYASSVGIVGLSVGNSIILAIVLEGGAQSIKLADHDRLTLSNTNRIRSGIDSLGDSKVEMTARQIYSINPYARVELFSNGLSEENIGEFFKKLDVVIDEIDDIPMKLRLREYAKKFQIPLVTAADEGDSGVVDIERYDLSKRVRPFGNHLAKLSYRDVLGADYGTIGKIIIQMIGPKNIPPPMQYSLSRIGKEIVSWPQLGGTALLNGAAVAYALRRILNKKPVNEHAIISLDAELIPKYRAKEAVAKRARLTKSFVKKFHLWAKRV
ncbi:MAG: ThiF family adenylyltransferase [bacterium]|nr:ThiF family adenylyltransferase [bacterium]